MELIMGREVNDTIAAISTPPGEGGIGIVRISGEKALEISKKIFLRAKDKDKLPEQRKKNFLKPRRIYYGYIIDDEDSVVDEVLLTYMKAPNTYTCEDVIEISGHGGIVPLRKILQISTRMGARPADPGEFTKRAFLNGRIDLAQAESVLSIIKAKTEKGLEAALTNLRGNISREIKFIRDELISVLADVEAELEFSHEDLWFDEDHYEMIKKRLKEIQRRLEIIHENSKKGKILQEGLKAVIAGRPNVGKSSLYNYLVKEERAIVTEIPGTTRDTLQELINIKGVPLKIIDTAGFRKDGDKVEVMGMTFSRRALEEADIIIFMLDSSIGVTEEDIWIYQEIIKDSNKTVLLVPNKIDKGKMLAEEEYKEILNVENVFEVSLLEGKGIEQLEDAIYNTVFSGEIGEIESVALLDARQEEIITMAINYLNDALMSMENKVPLDIITIDLNSLHHKLGELLGENIGEDVLNQVFDKFCIGK